ncbi:hypothetical protein SGQ44_18285 [Flavobacterium sp. Fl-77]|uniref:Uncharacterized protein n=1 Tax=Flavobacterium flavipigmentatum TaxID=2893884 RepID=A0AAJ2SK76_9FLAO|nr:MULTISPECIES: hypothetical protein [unclassified Flavobacterium]MDX6181929.1 hypothetical protein [Flavobacterium sp. Fl-33]MDX6187704.1 hypothetical protein [Flavobacterium sp. Fl-77]UFH37147.1 hypothetical protein LNP22_10415 [Flavobacterium sp. F-70]
MKAIYFLLLLFTVNSFAQTATEKYNTYLKRFEYFDSRGNLTGYKQYNSYLNQWEYYENKHQGYEIKQPQSSIDVDLVQKTLSSKQSRYDYNLKRIQESINSSTLYLYASSKNKGYSYEESKRSVTEFEAYYVNKVRYGKYDLSYNSVADDLIGFLSKGALKIACDNFKDCN